jgi:hypothetical protein
MPQASHLVVGDTVHVEGLDLRPIARVHRVSIPFLEFTWLRPVAVQLRNEQGSLEHIRIQDRSRLWLISLTLLLTFSGWLLFKVGRFKG